MNSVVARLLSLLLVAFLAVYTGYQAYRYFYSPYRTERAISYHVTDSVRMKALVLREEAALPFHGGGVLSLLARDGEKVNDRSLLGYVYASEEQAQYMNRVAELEQEIRRLEALGTPEALMHLNVGLLGNQISGQLVQLSQLSASGNAGLEQDMLGSLQELLNKRQLVTGQTQSFSGAIARLTQEKESLLARASGAYTQIVSPGAGYFSRYTDGHEATLTPALLEELNNSQLAALISGSYPQSTNTLGKLVTSHNWYLAALLPKREAAKFIPGNVVTLALATKSLTPIPAVVWEVGQAENDLCRVVLRCDIISADLLTMRNPTLKVNFKQYSGLRVSNQAIRIVDGQTGVYVKTGYDIQFRPVRVIYEEAGYVICSNEPLEVLQDGQPYTPPDELQMQEEDALQEEETSDRPKGLNLLDEVIIGGVGLYDGKPLT